MAVIKSSCNRNDLLRERNAEIVHLVERTTSTGSTAENFKDTQLPR
ncbi:hypothetical protein PC116_g32404 [Phytophthora cactorum]|nr:hypothetical protein PC116_g32404 [Phytophthora cactorum]